ncbi:tryptophan--tRNA ligase [Candidatus Woesearchaeota archaeon]|nr:tryptophan--tRNA ligase [Candidatus Woesearchaeota archaeon]MCF7901573.1 tryptophan--tRNA ligase [Candidatus Woesearchaeota archaeon]MCF8013970.1 tryptophan--tRNA ligase [Candidatus Woesearchaeota archaeon]
MATITPWEVKGNIDYDKMIKEFGLKKIDPELLTRIEKIAQKKGKKLHRLLRRQLFYAHRELKWFLDEYEKGNKVFMYTGCGPSGPIHLGHYMIWEFTKYLQDILDIELWFQFTDDEKFLFKNQTYEEIQKWTKENMLDVIAIGYNPKKTFFLQDTKHANLMYPEAIKVAKKITFSTVKGAFGFTNDKSIGEIFFTAMQAVPAFLPSVINNKKMPCLIPHAIDQDPHFRITRDVIEKLGHHKPASIQSKFMPGLSGMEDGKQSSSSGKAIYMSDTPKEVKKKINKYAFSGGKDTVEEHRKLGGNPDVDVSYQWLLFFEDDDEKIKQIYADYKSGKILSGELKAILIETVNKILKEHQERRAKANSEEFIYKN